MSNDGLYMPLSISIASFLVNVEERWPDSYNFRETKEMVINNV